MQNQHSLSRNNGKSSQECINNTESEGDIEAAASQSDGQTMVGSKRTFWQMRRRDSLTAAQIDESHLETAIAEQKKNWGNFSGSPLGERQLLPNPFLLDKLQQRAFDSTSGGKITQPFDPIEEEKTGPAARAATAFNNRPMQLSNEAEEEEEYIPMALPAAVTPASSSKEEDQNIAAAAKQNSTVQIKSGEFSQKGYEQLLPPRMTMINTCEAKKDESHNNSKENSGEWNQENSSKILIQIHRQVTTPQVATPQVIYDKNIINDYKTIKMQVLINCIEEQGNLPRQDVFINTMKIVREFKTVGMQMLIFRHKLPDVQNNTLLLKSILGFKPAGVDTADGLSQVDSLQTVIPEIKKKIPIFLLVLTKLFAVEELRIFLENCNQMGQTALHYATRNKLEDVVEFLIKKCQVNVNLVNKMGNTPLHIAVLNNYSTIAKMLVSAKVDVLIENKEGYNCLHHSQRMELIDMCEYLDPIVIHAEIWQQKNCLVKLLVSKEGTKFQHISEGVFREIIKYA